MKVTRWRALARRGGLPGLLLAGTYVVVRSACSRKPLRFAALAVIAGALAAAWMAGLSCHYGPDGPRYVSDGPRYVSEALHREHDAWMARERAAWMAGRTGRGGIPLSNVTHPNA